MHPRLARALAGAALAAALTVAWWVILRALPHWPLRLVRDDAACREDFGCSFGAGLVNVVLTIAVVVGISMAVGWLILWALRVRPAWPIALLGPVLGWVVWWLAGPVLDTVFGETLWRAVVAFALGYGLAGSLSAARKA